jgi:protein-tyrosine phosphatase
MASFIFWNKKTPKLAENFLEVDVHSHLLPGIDDGANDLEESIALIKELVCLGYKKIITTPHIMGDHFRNDPEIILNKLELVRQELKRQNIKVELDAAAEYYLDEHFIKLLSTKQPLLNFGDKYVLFETSFLNEPSQLKEVIFEIAAAGYKPMLAHPERYIYMYDSFKKYEDLFDRGCYFQLNLNSLCGYYNKMAKKIAEKLIDAQMINLVGTDCHGFRHLDTLKSVHAEKYFTKLKDLDLINHQLLA